MQSLFWMQNTNLHTQSALSLFIKKKLKIIDKTQHSISYFA